jgi:hypothetical protein
MSGNPKSAAFAGYGAILIRSRACLAASVTSEPTGTALRALTR